MKHDFTDVSHPAAANTKLAGSHFSKWSAAPFIVPVLAAIFLVPFSAAYVGSHTGELFGQKNEQDELLKAEQMKACRAITGKTDTEIVQMSAKCQEIHPGIFGP